jgi:hypothetical protein
MALQTALTANQLKMLRGTSTIKRRAVVAPNVSLLPGTILLAARVNGTPTGDAFSQITYNTVTTGSYTNLKVGHRVMISHTSSIQDRYFDGRLTWQIATSSILYINRTSELVTHSDYIWVIEDFPILERRLFVNADGSFSYDYDEVFSGLPPIIGGVQGVYAGFVDPTSNKLRVSFAATIYAGESGATIASILYSTPDGTVIAGALNTANVTIDFAPGFRFVDLTATDSGGRAWTLHIKVFAEPRDGTSTTLLTGVTGVSLQGDISQGFSGSLDAFGDLSSLLPNHALCIWDDESLSGAITLVGATTNASATVTLASTAKLIVGQRVKGTGIPGNTTISAISDATHITLSANATATGSVRISFKSTSIGSNIRFVGRFQNESNRTQGDPSYGPIQTTSFPLESEAQQLARIEGPRVTTEHSASPANPNEIKNWTPWRAAFLVLAKYSTFLLTNALTIPDRADTYLFEGRNTDGGGCLNTVNGIGQGVAQTVLQFTPWGSAEFARHGFYLDDESARSALPIIADLTAQDLLADSQIDIQYTPSVSLVDASGGTWNSTTDFVAPMRVFSPGPERSTGDSPNALPRQILKANVSILTAQTDLINRAGNERRKGIGKATMTLRHPDGYGFFIPAINQWYRFTLADTDTNLRGISITTATRWIVDKVSYAWDAVAGTKEVQTSYLQETNGVGEGKIITDPSSDDNGLPDLDFPGDIYTEDFSSEIPGEDVYLLNEGVGILAAFLDDGNLATTTDFSTQSVSGGPTWLTTSLGVTGTPLQFVVDAYSPRYISGSGAVNGWLVTSTKIYRIDDIFGSPSATAQHTFAAASPYRAMDFSFGTQNWGIVTSYYEGAGTKATYTTDGSTWTEVTITGHYMTSTGYNLSPDVYVSPRTPGLAYTSAFTSTADYLTVTATGYYSMDYGATWAAMTNPAITLTNFLANKIHVPYGTGDDNTVYYGDIDLDAAEGFIKKAVGVGVTDITPTIIGLTYTLRGPRSLHSCPINASNVAAIGQDSGVGAYVAFVSTSAGAAWTTIDNPTDYRGLAVAGDNDQILYLWGINGALGYSNDFGATRDSRSDNLGSSATIIGICGG